MTRTAHARVNWGRWIVDCPDPACPNAEDVIPGAPRAHCSFCDRAMLVEWPDDRADIERVLWLRPVPSTRNWWPGETVDMLIAENIEHEVVA